MSSAIGEVALFCLGIQLSSVCVVSGRFSFSCGLHADSNLLRSPIKLAESASGAHGKRCFGPIRRHLSSDSVGFDTAASPTVAPYRQAQARRIGAVTQSIPY